MARLKFQPISSKKQIQRNIAPTLGQEIREYFLYFITNLIFVGLVYIIVRTSLFDLIGIDGQSMFPTFNESTDDDSIYIDQLTPKFSDYRRGDVIVFLPPEKCSPKDKDGNQPFYIKRVIGLPGEKVAFENGQVYIINDENPEPGILLDETSYLPKDFKTFPNALQSTGTRIISDVVQEGEVFFLGDNRSNSVDSRVCGPVEKNQILGREFFRQSPEDKRGFFELPNYNIGSQ